MEPLAAICEPVGIDWRHRTGGRCGHDRYRRPRIASRLVRFEGGSPQGWLEGGVFDVCPSGVLLALGLIIAAVRFTRPFGAEAYGVVLASGALLMVGYATGLWPRCSPRFAWPLVPSTRGARGRSGAGCGP